MTQATLALRATQQTALTPRLQQSVRLLQLSSHDFAQELEQALATNPFLDVPSPDEDASGDTDLYRSAATFDASATDPIDRDSFVESIVVDATIAGASGVSLVDQRSSNAEAFDGIGEADTGNDGAEAAGEELYDFGSFGERSNLRDGDDADPGHRAQAVETLRTHLHEALVGHRLSQRERALAELVIEALDDDGHLRQDLEDAVRCFDFRPDVAATELDTALELVQRLGPAGIGARSVSECLALQIDALREQDCADHSACDADRLAIARAMVCDHIERVASRDHAAIRRSLGCTLEAVVEAAELIRGLDPRPGSAFCGDVAPAVIPDVIVRRLRSGWHTDINPAVIPRLCLNRVYAALYHDARGGDRQPLGQQLQEARWLLRNAAQRFVTIRRVARVIVAEQAAFLDYGDIALRPLLLRQVADQLELHESTISRAIGNKFMATPRGVFAFKHFFSRKLATVSGGSCSATSIRAAMRELIERENRSEPMSDVELARRLTEQGLCVARRTVTKYRGQMRIAPVEMRRRAEATPPRRSATQGSAGTSAGL